MSTQQERIQELKEKYIGYFEEVPVQKYAAMYVGRNEDTIIDWKNKDPDFADKVTEAEAKWIKKNVRQAKPEFKLERMKKEIFNQNVDLTTKGDKLPSPILGGASKEGDDGETTS